MKKNRSLYGLVLAGGLIIGSGAQAQNTDPAYFRQLKELRPIIKQFAKDCNHKALEKLGSKSDRNPEEFEDKMLTAFDDCLGTLADLQAGYEAIAYPEDNAPGDEDEF